MLRLTGMDITLCPHCKKGKMRLVAELSKNTHSTVTQIIRRKIIRKAA
jgi:ribosomal protein L44E